MPSQNSPILAQLKNNRGPAKGRQVLLGAATLVCACFGVVAAFGNVSSGLEISFPQQNVVESLSLLEATPVDEAGALFIREEKVRPGDSVSSLLLRLGIEESRMIDEARNNAEAQPLFRQLLPGKTVTAYMDRDGGLHSLLFPLSDKQDHALELSETQGGLRVVQKALTLEPRIEVRSADINYSLFGATDAAGIPDGIASQLVDVFGGDIDFHRDLRRGDHFSVAYETMTHAGKPVRSGRILAAEFINAGHSHKAVWFQDIDGGGGYYTPDGKSLHKAFLRSPLEFSRVTSGFSLARFHPVLQRWRAHKGVDYGAPSGTRVRATSDAVVDFVGTQNGYGRVIVLRHQGPYTTLYGHLSGFAPGIRKGTRVSQGDVIGYVGQTGLASGPHLHYEFRINGSFKDPLAVALPGSPPLNSDQLARFHAYSGEWRARIDAVRHINLASAE